MSILETTPNRNSNYTIGSGLAVKNENLQINLSDNVDNIASFDDNKLYVPGNSIPYIKPMIQVTIIPASQGVQITLTKGTYSTQASTDENGVVEFEVDHFGQYTISGTVNDKSVSKDVVVDSVERYPVYLAGVNVYGVAWDRTNPSPQLVRLTPENDVNGYCTNIIDGEPQPAVGIDTGYSPCDELYPWKDMIQYNIIDGVVEYSQNDEGFSRDYETFVYIPKFWYKIVQTNDVTFYYVADSEAYDFEAHPGSDNYLGRYNMGNDYGSKTRVNVLLTTLSNIQTHYPSGSSQYSSLDIVTISAIQLLYLVEFINFNSQSVIGAGMATGSTSTGAGQTGQTDLMLYHTGKASTATTAHIQYRWLEDLWGCVWNAVDGMTIINRRCYVCTDYPKYSMTSVDDYIDTELSCTSSDNYIRTLSHPDAAPWLFLPTSTSGASASTYTCDFQYQATGTRCALYGGGFSTTAERCGIFACGYNQTPSTTGSNFGGRLMFHTKPVSDFEEGSDVP